MLPRSEQSNECGAAEKQRRIVAAALPRRRNALIFLFTGLVWLVLDLMTKGVVNAYDQGELIAGPFAGMIDFKLVYNTGAAWGIFSDMTFVLGVLAMAVCLSLLVYLFVLAPNSSPLCAFGAALVFAGGLGNALDRFTLGYVVDFIEPVFIDFPVFNIADIGVTCGIVLFLAALALELRKEARKEAAQGK